jgi:hypothetical protein
MRTAQDWRLNKLMRQRTIILAAAVLLPTCGSAFGQVVLPFFSPTGTAFTPEIGVVNTGVLNDVTAVVSADQKYVTLTMGASNANLLALREFSFQANNAPGANAAPARLGAAAPKEATILDRPGITRVD